MPCTYSIGDVCIPITIDIPQSSYAVNKDWIAGAFILGLLIGILIAAVLVRPCIRSWRKKRRQDGEEEEQMYGSPTAAAAVVPTVVTATAVESPRRGKSGKRKGSRLLNRKKSGRVDPDVEDEDVEPGKYRGMVDVLTQTTGTGSEGELLKQDVATITEMEDDMDEEKQQVQLRVLDNLMKSLVANSGITETYYSDFMHKTRTDLIGIKTLVKSEVEEAEEAAKKDNKLSKDSQALETELQSIQAKGHAKQNQMEREHKEKMRKYLIRTSGMSEADVDALFEKLMGHVAALEDKLGSEQSRQKRNLAERLAKRRQVVDYKNMLKQNQTEDIDTRVDMLKGTLSGLVTDNKLNEKQKDELLRQFREEVDVLRHHHDVEAMRQRESLAEKLRHRRQKEMNRLMTKQKKERAVYLQSTEREGSKEFVKGYHELVTKQHSEVEEASQERDQTEVQELDKATKESFEKEADELDEKLAIHIAETGRQANLGRTDINGILQQQQQEMDLYQGKKQKERQAMLARLQERLAHRLQRIEQEEQKEELEMETLVEQQTATITKMLATNIELSEDARDRIMREHEQNMKSLTNQLQRSKLKQQKNLELKLSQRQARLEQLKNDQAKLERAKPQMKEKEAHKAEEKLAKEIAAEEAKLKVERFAAIDVLKQQLAAETEMLLKQQDQELGQLIGRLQVGQARRQAILHKQDKKLKELQDKLEAQIEQGVEMPKSYTEQLIQQHQNQVAHLEDHIQRSREKQERVIMDRLQTKRHMKEDQIDSQIEEEAQVEFESQKQRGAGKASGILMNALVQSRHKRAIAELDAEMKAELERSKDELNSALEQEMQKELSHQKQQFLKQLADVSGMTEEDVRDAL